MFFIFYFLSIWKTAALKWRSIEIKGICTFSVNIYLRKHKKNAVKCIMYLFLTASITSRLLFFPCKLCYLRTILFEFLDKHKVYVNLHINAFLDEIHKKRLESSYKQPSIRIWRQIARAFKICYKLSCADMKRPKRLIYVQSRLEYTCMLHFKNRIAFLFAEKPFQVP